MSLGLRWLAAASAAALAVLAACGGDDGGGGVQACDQLVDHLAKTRARCQISDYAYAKELLSEAFHCQDLASSVDGKQLKQCLADVDSAACAVAEGIPTSCSSVIGTK